MHFPLRIHKRKVTRHMDPSFAEGVARLFDFGGAIDVSLPPQKVKTEAEGLRDIWLAVGRDLERASGHYTARATTGTRRRTE